MKPLRLLFVALLVLSASAFAVDPQFNGQCALGMAHAQKHATDCSIFWVGPDDKIYCFANPQAKQKFLQAPRENLTRAQAFWEDPENLKKLIRRE